MAFNISSFSSNIGRYGVVPNNKFFVVMTAPQLIRQTVYERGAGIDVGGIERLIQFRAEQARLPGVLLQTNDVRRYGLGVNEKMPFNAQFTDTSFTFLADSNGSIYRYFYSWLTSAVDFTGTLLNMSVPTYTTSYKDEYVTDIDIFVFDNYGMLVKQVTFYDAYPNSLNDVNLDWGNNNSVMKVTVGFTYKNWSVDAVTITGGGGGISFSTLARAFSSPSSAGYVVGSAIGNYINQSSGEGTSTARGGGGSFGFVDQTADPQSSRNGF